MGKPTPIAYTDQSLRHIVGLNKTGVSVTTLMRSFNLHGSDLSRMEKTLDDMEKDGVVYIDKNGKYIAENPMKDLAVVSVTRILSQKSIAVKIENVKSDFPVTAIMNRNQLKRITGSNYAKRDDMFAVVLDRHYGTGLKARPIGKFDGDNYPYILGHFNVAGEFVSEDPGIRTPLNTDETPSNPNPDKIFTAIITPDLDPNNPTLIIGERKWNPKTGVPIATILARKHGIITRHSKNTRQEAKQAIVQPILDCGRRDLTNERLKVVDPPDAKDHDDAFKIDDWRDGYRSLVTIADVAHFVRPGTVLDREAKKRGATRYLPDETYHMLPRALTWHASLREGTKKPVIYVEHFWDKNGNQVGPAQIGTGMIAAQKQMTYRQMDDLIIARVPEMAPYIKLGDMLIEKMRDRTLTLDSSETDPEGVFSQSLVSCMMVEANAAIAEYLIDHDIPFLSRSHSGNDNIYNFMTLRNQLQEWHYDAPDNIDDVTTETLNDVIKEALARGGPIERNKVENFILTNFLYQAHYTTQPHYHFGLGRPHYTHFTSPIRRYPDLLAGRGVHMALGNKDLGLSREDMTQMGKTAISMNAVQDTGRSFDNDRLKFYAISDLIRREGYVVTATLCRVDRRNVEISLNDPSGLRKQLPTQNLPPPWSLDRSGNALMYNGNRVATGASLRCRIVSVRPDQADWDIDSLEPAHMPVQHPRRAPAFQGGMS